jgi:hypothetical protein
LADVVRAAASQLGAQILDVDGGSIVLTMGPSRPTVTLDLDRLAWALRGVAEPGSLVVERVRAALKAAECPEDLDVTAVLPHLRPAGDSGPWTRSLVDGALRRALVVDGASTMRYLTPMDVVQSGLGLEALDAQAQINLALMTSQACVVEDGGLGCGVWTIHVGDGHDAARALIVGGLFPQAERLLVLMPTRDHLWVVPESGDSGVAKALALRATARDVALQSAYPISDAVFVHQSGSLAVFSPAVP